VDQGKAAHREGGKDSRRNISAIVDGFLCENLGLHLRQGAFRMSTKTRYLEDEPATEAECQMLNILREWSGNDNNRLTIEYRDGAWEIAMSMTPHGKNQTVRGVGATFDQAWDSINPNWA
jgi:hypothetical protein